MPPTQKLPPFLLSARARQVAEDAAAAGQKYMRTGFGGSDRAQQVVADAVARGQKPTVLPALNVTAERPAPRAAAPVMTPGQQYMAGFGGSGRAQQVSADAAAAGREYMKAGFGGSGRAQQVVADAVARGRTQALPVFSVTAERPVTRAAAPSMAPYAPLSFGNSDQLQRAELEALSAATAGQPYAAAVEAERPAVRTAAPMMSPGQKYMAGFGGSARAQQVSADAAAAGREYMQTGFGGSDRAQQVVAEAAARGQRSAAPTQGGAPTRQERLSIAQLLLPRGVRNAVTEGAQNVGQSWQDGNKAYAVGQAINIPFRAAMAGAMDAGKQGMSGAIATAMPLVDVLRGVAGLPPNSPASPVSVPSGATNASVPDTSPMREGTLQEFLRGSAPAQVQLQAQGQTAAATSGAQAADASTGQPNMLSAFEQVAKAYPNMNLRQMLALANAVPNTGGAAAANAPSRGSQLATERAIASIDREWKAMIVNPKLTEAEKVAEDRRLRLEYAQLANVQAGIFAPPIEE